MSTRFVRLATLDDVPELVRVINLAYHVEADMFHGLRTSDADVLERLNRSNATFLAIDDDAVDAPPGRLKGAVFVEVNDRRGHFGMLAVDPGKQGQGLGRVLVRAIEEYCANAGCADLDLDVVDLREGLPDFYEALGFTRTGLIPYPDPSQTKRPVHLIQMTKSLLVIPSGSEGSTVRRR